MAAQLLALLFVVGAAYPPLGRHPSLFLGTMAAGAPEAASASGASGGVEFIARGGPADFPGSTGADFVDLIARDAEALAQQQIPFGHKFITGGAGEGDQQLGGGGSQEAFEHREQVKSDNVLPAYCEPPNPCPEGFTAADGCLEDFDNTADFSRTYQAQQECLCDAEHMFNCPRGGGLTSPSQSQTTDDDEEGGGPTGKATTAEYEQGLEAMLAKNGLHKSMIAKKFHETRPLEPRRKRSALSEPHQPHHRAAAGHVANPFLRGTPLRSVAKKNGRHLHQM